MHQATIDHLNLAQFHLSQAKEALDDAGLCNDPGLSLDVSDLYTQTEEVYYAIEAGLPADWVERRKNIAKAERVTATEAA